MEYVVPIAVFLFFLAVLRHRERDGSPEPPRWAWAGVAALAALTFGVSLLARDASVGEAALAVVPFVCFAAIWAALVRRARRQ